MAIFTSTQAGNASAGSTWVGGVAPSTSGTDQIVCNHAVTIDVNYSLGTSGPPTPTNVPTASATGGGSVGGSLPSGTYRYKVTNVDSGGTESCGGPEGSAVTIASGNIPRFTIGALPSGVTSRNLYLSAAGGAALSETLYATGITGTTFDASSASWNNGTQSQAAAPALPASEAVKVNSTGSLTIASSVTLTLKGDMQFVNAPFTMNAGAGLVFNASSSVGTTNTYYWWRPCSANGQSSSTITISGNSGSYCTISTAASSANGIIGPLQDGSVGGPFTDYGNINVSYLRITKVGDTSRDGWVMTNLSATRTISIDHMIADTCVRMPRAFYSMPAASNWSLTNSSWKNTPAGSEPFRNTRGNTPSTGSATYTNLRLDQAPAIQGCGATYDGCYFDSGWVDPGASTAWSIMQNCVIRQRNTSIQNASGDVKNSFVFADNTASATSSTGTATSSTNSTSTGTLTDTLQSWTSAGFAPAGNNCWAIEITGGTGKGQIRAILTNTATVLTTYPTWDTLPDATSTYEIRQQLYNVHYLGPAAIARAFTFDKNLFQNLSVDNNGDCYYGLDKSGGSYTLSNSIILPSIIRDNSGTLMTLLQTDNRPVAVTHCTYFTGAQSAAIGEQTGTGTAGIVPNFLNSIAWCDPAKSSNYGTINSSLQAGLGPYIVCDSGHGTTNATTNIITTRDYCGSYGLLTVTGGGGHVGPDKWTYSVAPGAHDVTGDPQFVDRWRGLLQWGQTILGVSATAKVYGSTGQLASIANAILASNDPSDPNYNANVSLAGTGTSLVDWIRAGFAPQNVAYHNTASDGTDIGAVPFQAAGSSWPWFMDNELTSFANALGF